MQRIGTTNGLFIDGDQTTNTKGTICTAAWLNSLQEEIAEAIEGMGGTLNPSVNNQLLALLGLVAQENKWNYALDTGTANTYQVAYNPPVMALTDGMILSFRAKNANTGAATFSANGLNPVQIYSQAHVALLSGEIAAGGFVEVEYNSSLGGVVLLENSGGIAHGITPPAGNNSPQLSTTAFVQKVAQQSSSIISVAGGTANALTASFTPAITAVSNGMLLLVRATAANTVGNPSFTPNSGVIAVQTIVKGNGLPLALGDIAGAGHWLALQEDTVLGQWVLLNPASGINTGLAAAGIAIVTATGALTSGNVGGTVLINSSAATTQTLPAANAVPAGKRIEILNINTGVGTVSRVGTDTITVNSGTVTTLALGAGDTLTLESNGVNGWYAVAGSSQLGSSAMFAALKAGSGYQKLPSGLIIQWINNGSANTSGVTNTLPITFPNAIIGFIAFVNVATSSSIILGGQSMNTSQVQVYSSSGSPSITIFALGY